MICEEYFERYIEGRCVMPDISNSAEDMQVTCECCSGKHKERDEKEYKDLMNRLKRIEGQVRGVEGMLENDAYCTDILMQVSAITSALNSFNKALLANHMKTCVADNIRQGNDEVIDELVATLQKLMK
jgi:DNA-binding FrmR family transcriptional regulator